MNQFPEGKKLPETFQSFKKKSISCQISFQSEHSGGIEDVSSIISQNFVNRNERIQTKIDFRQQKNKHTRKNSSKPFQDVTHLIKCFLLVSRQPKIPKWLTYRITISQFHNFTGKHSKNS